MQTIRSKKNGRVRTLVFYVTRQESDSPLETDRVVLIGLNSHNKVKAIYSNVEGILTRNWPGIPMAEPHQPGRK
jgi:hypothetical protein